MMVFHGVMIYVKHSSKRCRKESRFFLLFKINMKILRQYHEHIPVPNTSIARYGNRGNTSEIYYDNSSRNIKLTEAYWNVLKFLVYKIVCFYGRIQTGKCLEKESCSLTKQSEAVVK